MADGRWGEGGGVVYRSQYKSERAPTVNIVIKFMKTGAGYAENRLIFFASFKNVTLLVLAKCPIKPRNLFIDGRKKTIVSCRNMEGDVERRVLSARPDWQIASITQTLATRQSKDI